MTNDLEPPKSSDLGSETHSGPFQSLWLCFCAVALRRRGVFSAAEMRGLLYFSEQFEGVSALLE